MRSVKIAGRVAAETLRSLSTELLKSGAAAMWFWRPRVAPAFRGQHGDNSSVASLAAGPGGPRLAQLPACFYHEVVN